MKSIFFVLFYSLLGPMHLATGNDEQVKSAIQKVDPVTASGTWTIDLRPDPKSPPYLKEIKFSNIKGNRFDGEFYGYPFTGGYFNTEWDKLYFAFTTSDQSGVYFHSGYIEKDSITGMSLNETRNQLWRWVGNRNK